MPVFRFSVGVSGVSPSEVSYRQALKGCARRCRVLPPIGEHYSYIRAMTTVSMFRGFPLFFSFFGEYL